MKHLISVRDRILKIAETLHWWTYFDLSFYFAGDAEKRLWWVESEVPKMYADGLLKRTKLGKRFYYTSWSQPMHLMHGIVCTRALLRFWGADRDCELIGENEFRKHKFGVVPEWGILYPNGSLLLCEYCTADNVGRNGLVPKKVNFYIRFTKSIQSHFNARVVVVFILESRDAMKTATQCEATSFIYFVERDKFFSVNPNDQITAPVYWLDGKEYPLR